MMQFPYIVLLVLVITGIAVTLSVLYAKSIVENTPPVFKVSTIQVNATHKLIAITVYGNINASCDNCIILYREYIPSSNTYSLILLKPIDKVTALYIDTLIVPLR